MAPWEVSVPSFRLSNTELTLQPNKSGSFWGTGHVGGAEIPFLASDVAEEEEVIRARSKNKPVKVRHQKSLMKSIG